MLELVVPLDSLMALETAQGCFELFAQQQGQSLSQVNLYHSPTTVSSVRRKLRNRRTFHLDGPGFDFDLSSVKNHDLGFLTVDGVQVGLEHRWVLRLGGDRLVSARIYDKEYEHWQNAEDPLEYEAVGRSMNGLPMRSNELPPPLDQLVVDTSRNPGRRRLRTGYVEAVGHRMWLGSEFFERVPGCERDAVLRAPGFEVRDLVDGSLEVTAHPEPFVDDSTAQIQEQLRALLFPISP